MTCRNPVPPLKTQCCLHFLICESDSIMHFLSCAFDLGNLNAHFKKYLKYVTKTWLFRIKYKNTSALLSAHYYIWSMIKSAVTFTILWFFRGQNPVILKGIHAIRNFAKDFCIGFKLVMQIRNVSTNRKPLGLHVTSVWKVLHTLLHYCQLTMNLFFACANLTTL